MNIIPVILCGGSGTRLWPLSRMETPKQFLTLFDDETLLQKTALRTLNICDRREMVIVTLEEMREETIRQLGEISPFLTRHILGEPEARNTAAAVAYALNYVVDRFGEDAFMWVLPADHFIGDELALQEALDRALEAARNDYLVTFGIEPTRAETGYGYIKKGNKHITRDVLGVESFVEKPLEEVAQKFVDSGEYLWSSGMHLFSARAAIAEYKKLSPDTWRTMERIFKAAPAKQKLLQEHYSLIKKEPFETAVLEKAENIAVVPCDPEWSDIGCWESIWEIKSKNGDGNALDGKVVCENTQDSMVLAQDRLVTCVGLKNVIIVETGDAVLVADKKSNGSLKSMVEVLKARDFKEIREPVIHHHVWGICRELSGFSRCKLYEITIKPGQTRIIEKDESFSGHCLVVEGTAFVRVETGFKKLEEKQIYNLLPDFSYSFTNNGSKDLKLFEFRNAEERESESADLVPAGHESVAAEIYHRHAQGAL